MKNHRNNDSGTRRIEHNTPKHENFRKTKQECREGRESDRRIISSKFHVEE